MGEGRSLYTAFSFMEERWTRNIIKIIHTLSIECCRAEAVKQDAAIMCEGSTGKKLSDEERSLKCRSCCSFTANCTLSQSLHVARSPAYSQTKQKQKNIQRGLLLQTVWSQPHFTIKSPIRPLKTLTDYYLKSDASKSKLQTLHQWRKYLFRLL